MSRNAILSLTLAAAGCAMSVSCPRSIPLASASSQPGLSFEVNRGQAPPDIQLLAHGKGRTLYLTTRGSEVVVNSPARPPAAERLTTVNAEVVGARLSAPIPEGKTEERSHYYYGGAVARSVTDVEHYQRVRYRGAYPGIDLVYYGGSAGLEYDFVVQPSANPSTIAVRYSGMEALRIDGEGNLNLDTPGGSITHRRPVAYQEVDGARLPVACSYAPGAKSEDGSVTVRFRLAGYDPTRPLVIDPVLDFATYLGGREDEWGRAIAVRSNGKNVYIAGDTTSLDFPGESYPSRWGRHSGQDAFVTCLDSQGRLKWTAFLIGSGDDVPSDVQVDASGNVGVVGNTTSDDFPTVLALQDTFGAGGADGFMAKLSSTGSRLLFSSYIGGPGPEGGANLAITRTGDWWVLQEAGPGLTTTADAAQPDYGGGYQDAYLTKIHFAGKRKPRNVYSTYIGGGDYDPPSGLGLDAKGNVYASGNTLSDDFPTTKNAYQTTHAAFEDAWVTKIGPNGGPFLYSTYIGGTGVDYSFDSAVSAAGEVYLACANVGGGFPTTPGAFQENAPGGAHDGVVVRLNAAGSDLVYSTYVGTSGFDAVRGIAIDASGRAYLGIDTDSPNFPTVNPIQDTYGGSGDAAVAVLNPAGSALDFSTFIGGTGLDQCFYDCIAVSKSGAIYLTGRTSSPDFPTAHALQSEFQGGPFDAFVVRLHR